MTSPVASPVVTALVLVGEGDAMTSVRATLAAVAAQTRAADHVLLVVPPGLEVEHARHLDPDRGAAVVAAHGDALAARCSAALAVLETEPAASSPVNGTEGTLGTAPARWIWCVPVGSDPGRGALAAQLDRLAAEPELAVVGAKQVRHRHAPTASPGTADAADGLVDVGVTLTHGARIVSGVDRAEIDQGQDDWRRDVLAVDLPGLLVDEDLLRELGGFDPALDERWAPIELCHRVWRAGRRVEVAPAARFLALAETEDREAFRSRRAGRSATLMALRPLPLAVLTALWVPVAALLHILGAVVVHRPGRVADEAAAAGRALRAAPGVIARARRASRRARVSRRRLAPLFLPRREAVHRILVAAWTRTLADDDRSRRIRRTSWGIAGTAHGADDADTGYRTGWTAGVGVLAVLGALWVLRRVLGGGDLVGPGLVPLPESWRDTWQAAWSDWVPGGLGAAGPADPLIRLLGQIPAPGSALVEVLVLAALPAAALAAWWASGALTRSVGARLVLTAAWTLAPSFLGALADGRWPLLIVHMLLPLLALAIGRAIGLPHKRSQASVSAAAGGGLLLLVIGAVQPVLVLLAIGALVLIAPSVPGRRLRLVWTLLPSLALHAAYVQTYVRHPRTLLSVGAQHATAAVPSRLAGLWLAPDHGWAGLLAPLLGADLALWAPLVLLIPLALAALAAPFLASDAGRAGRVGMVLAGTAVILAVASAHVPVDLVGTRVLPAPPHALVSVATLALLLAAGCTLDALARRHPGVGVARRRLTALCAGVLALTSAALVAGWALALPSGLRLERGDGREIPAAAADQGRSDARLRTLVLGDGPRTPGAPVPAHLVVGGGADATQDSAVAQSRLLERARGGASPDAADGALLSASSALLAGSTDAARLRDLAVGYVVVPSPARRDTTLITALDASPLLERVTEGSGGHLWRVVDPQARATLGSARSGASRTVLASDVIDVHGRVPGATTPRTIELAERYDGSWRARVGGTELEGVRVDGWAQGFLVPAGTRGRLVIDTAEPLSRLAALVLAVAVGLTVLMAVPWRGRHVREEEIA